MIERAFEEVAGCEYRLCVNRQGSAALEILLRQCDAVKYRQFLNVLITKGFVLALSVDRCGSHVLQTAIERCDVLLDLDEANDSIAGVPSLRDILVTFSNLFGEHLPELMCDPCCSHVLRCIIRVLSGQQARPPSTRGSPTIPPRKFSVSVPIPIPST
jgi:hypothetical protein